MRRLAAILAVITSALLLAAGLAARAPAQTQPATIYRISDLGSLGAGSGNWKILVLIYGRTDQSWTDAADVPHHVIAQMTDAEKQAAATAARQFAEIDIPRLTSGVMVPAATVRFPDRTLTDLDPNGTGFWPSPADTTPERDPAFDSVIVIWDPRGTSQLTGQPEWIGSAAGLTPAMGTGQTYETQIIESVFYGHRNVFKHEYGHSLLSYFDASGQAPKPAVSNHTDAGTYVHCPTGESYVWQDETLANPIPDSIYNNDSGFTHDYYSGTTALAGQPTRCLGIARQAWGLGGPVTPGPLSGSSDGMDVDGHGRIAGSTATAPGDRRFGPHHAFVWQDGTMTDITGAADSGASYASAIADRGQQTLVAGGSTTASGGFDATLWMGGEVIHLGTMGRTGVGSFASDVNSKAQVVGSVGLDAELFHPFLWENGVMKDLVGFPDGGSGTAEAINRSGEVVGWSEAAPEFGPQPFLWKDGKLRDLGSLGGTSGQANGVNDDGDVVGASQTAGGEQHAFLWLKHTGAMIDLGTLGGPASVAYGINNRGQVVGEGRTASGETHAFVWENGVMRDLGTLGGSYSTARDINDKGQIVGSSIDKLGRTRAALWSASR